MAGWAFRCGTCALTDTASGMTLGCSHARHETRNLDRALLRTGREGHGLWGSTPVFVHAHVYVHVDASADEYLEHRISVRRDDGCKQASKADTSANDAACPCIHARLPSEEERARARLAAFALVCAAYCLTTSRLKPSSCRPTLIGRSRLGSPNSRARRRSTDR